MYHNEESKEDKKQRMEGGRETRREGEERRGREEVGGLCQPVTVHSKSMNNEKDPDKEWINVLGGSITSRLTWDIVLHSKIVHPVNF